MLFHTFLVQEIQRIMPDATYVKRGYVYGKFRLPNKQYVTVNKSGPTTVVVRFQLLRTPGRPEDGYLDRAYGHG